MDFGKIRMFGFVARGELLCRLMRLHLIKDSAYMHMNSKYLLHGFAAAFLEAAGYSKKEVAAMGNLSRLGREQVSDLMKKKFDERLAAQNSEN